jgi:hypothetical protein
VADLEGGGGETEINIICVRVVLVEINVRFIRIK